MDVGMLLLFASYGWEHSGDDQVWGEELKLARLAAESGFDVLWSAEHHFFDYAFCPDNLQLMTYLAGLYPDLVSRAFFVIALCRSLDEVPLPCAHA